MKTFYKLRHLIKGIVHKQAKSERYIYKTRKTFLGFTLREEGVYVWWKDEPVKLPDNYFLRDNSVFVKPYVTLYFTDGIIYEKHFDEYSEAVKYLEYIKTRNSETSIEL